MGAVAGCIGSGPIAWASVSPQIQNAADAFHQAAEHFIRTRHTTFYEGRSERRVFGPGDNHLDVSWGQALSELDRSAEAIFSTEAQCAADVRCKFSVADVLYGKRALPDTELSYYKGKKWLRKLSAEADQFDMKMPDAWPKRISDFFALPEDDFYHALGRAIGKVGDIEASSLTN